MKIFAVIPAAGIGSRFGTEIPKQYQPLAGKTVLEQSIRRLLECKEISEVWVALNQQDRLWHSIDPQIRKSIQSIIGGAERADSVRMAISAIIGADKEDLVLVHDAVRPLVNPKIVSALISSLNATEPGAILAMPICETVKQADQQQMVAATLDRSTLWTAQTPQVFRYGLLKAALETTRGDPAITDEAAAMEACGHSVRLFPGHRHNFKITHPEDLVLAEQLLIAEKKLCE